MEEFKIDEKIKERFRKRVGLTTRLNGLQHLLLWDAAWREHRSMGSIIREATMEYLRIVHKYEVPKELTNKAEDFFL